MGDDASRHSSLPATMPLLLKHIGLKPDQYSPLSKLKLACTIGDAEAVKNLLASGLDPLATGAPIDWHHDTPAIHHCIVRAQPACLEAFVATGNLEVLEQVHCDLTPLELAIENIVEENYCCTVCASKILECVKILIEAGADIGPVRIWNWEYDFDLELESMLEDAWSLRFSRLTHHKFPRPARAFAGEALRLGYQLASKIGSGALPSVWEEHIMPFLVARTSRPMAYASDLDESLAHRNAVVKIKGATRDTIVKDASLRAAMLDGSLTVRTVREAVVKRCRLSGKTAAELKTKYRDYIKAEMLSVQEAFQESRVWPNVVEVIKVEDVGATRGFEPGLVCQALVKTSCGSIYQLRTTKKSYRLAAFPHLRSDFCLRLAPWNGQIPWNAEPTRRVTEALAALNERKHRRRIYVPSRIPKKRRRRS